MMRMGTVAVLLLVSGSLWGGDAVGFRGDGMGQYSAPGAVLEWGLEENVRWSTPLPVWSNACPVVWGDRVFICAEQQKLLCLSVQTGELQWEREVSFSDTLNAAVREPFAAMVGKVKTLEALQRRVADKPAALELHRELAALHSELASREENAELLALVAAGRLPKTHGKNGYSSPTPVTEGAHVWALYGSGVAACFTVDGEPVWVRHVARPRHAWGHSASPRLVDGALLVHISRELHALDAQSGAPRWKASSGSTWGTPLPVRCGADWGVVTTGGDLVRVRDGAVVARRVVELPWGSPIAHDGVLYAFDAKGAKAVEVPDALPDKVEPVVRWKTKVKADRYYASPLWHDGLLYGITQKGHLTVLDAKSGALIYEKALKLGGTCYPSPTLAGGRLLVSSDNGTTLVLAAGREYRELASNKLDGFRSSPVFAGDRMLVRTLKALRCIGPE